MNAMAVSVVSLLASLFLAVRGMRAQEVPARRRAIMLAIWAAIIAALALILERGQP